MKIRIIKANEIDMRCLSPLLYTNSCEECNRLWRCNIKDKRVLKGKIRALEAMKQKLNKQQHIVEKKLLCLYKKTKRGK